MDIIHAPLRYAHEEGHTDVCYALDGQNIISCGNDCDIRIWPVVESEDPEHACIGEWSLSVRQKGDKIYVATDSNEIKIFSYPEGKPHGVLTRSTHPFNQIALCKNKNIAALAGEGMQVTIIDLETNSQKALLPVGGPCLSVAICPNGLKVAASTGDGKLQIWDVEFGWLVLDFMCFPKVDSFASAKNLCRLEFNPEDGATLAYPVENTIRLLNTNSLVVELLNCRGITAEFSILNYSACGKYLAAATLAGDFVIWGTRNNCVFQVTKHETSQAICGLMWNPTGNGEIVYTDIEGQLSIMSNCAGLQKKAKVEDNLADFGNIMFKDNYGENNVNQPTGLEFKSTSVKDPSPTRPFIPEIPLQDPFMPSSSQNKDEHRYLCYNDIGIVRSYGGNEFLDMPTNNIEVEFHDSTVHNDMVIENFQAYTMGSLGKGALVVANSRHMMVKPLADPDKAWTLKCEDSEEITLVAASEFLACYATKNYLIRVCSVFGSQWAVVSVPGPVVCMAAFKNVLIVAYHAGGIRNGDQCINVKMFKFEGYNVQCLDLGSALGPESTLSWLGFSDVGTPGMLDSLGMFSLFPPKCNTWIPYCDTSRHRDDPRQALFVTAVSESYQAIRGIMVVGGNPGFIPRPPVSELPIAAPFAECNFRSHLEMNMFSWSNLNIMNSENKYNEGALQLFTLACNNELDQRAFEVMQTISNQQILNSGIEYSLKLHKRRLTEKLVALTSRWQEEDQKEEESPGTSHSGASEMLSPDLDFKPKPVKLEDSETTCENKSQSTYEISLFPVKTEELPTQPKKLSLKKPKNKPKEDLKHSQDSILSLFSTRRTQCCPQVPETTQQNSSEVKVKRKLFLDEDEPTAKQGKWDKSMFFKK